MQPTLAAISRAQILCQQSSHSPSDLLSELAEFYELLTYACAAGKEVLDFMIMNMQISVGVDGRIALGSRHRC